MSQPQVFNNTTYSIPVQGDLRWGPALTRYLAALGTYAISPAGGTYALTANLNLGTSFGLLSKFYSSSAASPASAGLLRLANAELIEWRNFGGGGNNTLGVDSSDRLVFNGTAIQPLLSLTDGQIWIGSASNLPVGQTLSGAITTTRSGVTSLASNYVTDAMVNSAAAIAYSKLNLSGSITNTDIYSSAAIAYSKLALTGSIVNADIATTAAIAYSKLALTGTIVNADVNASAAIAYSKLALTGSLVNADVNASAAIAYSKLALTGTILNADINASAAIAYSKLNLAGSVSLATDVTGNLGVTHLNSGTSASGTTFWRGDGTWATPAGSGTVNSGTAGRLSLYASTTNAVSDTYVQNTKNITLAVAAQASRSADLALTIPNPGDAITAANLVLDQGAYTIAGAWTHSATLTMSGATIAMGSQKITGLANGTAGTDAAAFGQVKYLQAVQTTTSTSVSTTSSTFTAATNHSVAITPTSASNRVKVTATFRAYISAVGATIMKMTLKRGTTELSGVADGFAQFYSGAGGGTDLMTTITITYIDSPATTSATTYQVFFLSSNNSTSVTVGTATGLSVITAEEIV